MNAPPADQPFGPAPPPPPQQQQQPAQHTIHIQHHIQFHVPHGAQQHQPQQGGVNPQETALDRASVQFFKACEAGNVVEARRIFETTSVPIQSETTMSANGTLQVRYQGIDINQLFHVQHHHLTALVVAYMKAHRHVIPFLLEQGSDVHGLPPVSYHIYDFDFIIL